MKDQDKKSLWVLVHVARGIPVAVEAFYNLKSAEKRERLLRKNLNLNDDETGIFEIELSFVKS